MFVPNSFNKRNVVDDESVERLPYNDSFHSNASQSRALRPLNDGSVPERLLFGSTTPLTVPHESVIPYHVDTFGELSQFVLFVQSLPLVATYKSLRARHSLFGIVSDA